MAQSIRQEDGHAIGEMLVKDLAGMSFVVPSYQRGYRWEKTQVKELLDDISGFSSQDPNDRYCLQPIVVRKRGDGSYELVDGQQRLTTIFIIQRYSYWLMRTDERDFEIRYETRPDSWAFLTGEISEEGASWERNPDFYYMHQAWCAIEEWRAEKGMNPFSFLTNVTGKLSDNVMLIWYEMPESGDPISMFRRLNVGKVPLTNAELVKGLLLSQAKSDPDPSLPDKIALSWDNIEHSLQREPLWLFLTNRSLASHDESTRIDLLFNIWAGSNAKSASAHEKADPYFAFRTISTKLHEECLTPRQLWAEVEDIYSTLSYWYSENELYHKIGYLVASETTNVGELFGQLEGLEKSAVSSRLDALVARSLGKHSDRNALRQLSYATGKEKSAIRKVLLLFNVLTVLQSGSSEGRFPFDLYKSQGWDIEHIHATASEPPRDESAENGNATNERRIYFESLKDTADDLGISAPAAFSAIDGFIASGNYSSEEKSLAFARDQCSELMESITGEQNGIANLTLLDSETNRSYGNDTFAAKRREIMLRDRRAAFIPPCTRNVFLKYYTLDRTQLNLTVWDRDDRKGYLESELGILSTLSSYLNGGNDE